jgi:hypothetical protein
MGIGAATGVITGGAGSAGSSVASSLALKGGAKVAC